MYILVREIPKYPPHRNEAASVGCVTCRNWSDFEKQWSFQGSWVNKLRPFYKLLFESYRLKPDTLKRKLKLSTCMDLLHMYSNRTLLKLETLTSNRAPACHSAQNISRLVTSGLANYHEEQPIWDWDCPGFRVFKATMPNFFVACFETLAIVVRLPAHETEP